MKKKIFALLLALLMLLPCIVACGGNNDPGTQPPEGGEGGEGGEQTPPEDIIVDFKNDDEDKTLPIGSINSRDEVEKDAADRSKLYDGKTFKILATTWGGDLSKAGAPWGQAELTISPSDINDDAKMDGGFGRIINTSLIERENLIKEVYGISLEWVNAKANKISNILATNLNNPAGEKYHLAMPRMLEAQALVESQMVVNLNNSPSIDLSKPYFNQVARESYSVGGNTYFVAGDFSFLDEQTSFLIFYNLSLGEKVGNLYRKVKNGTWTISEMIKAAQQVGSDDGDESTGTWADDDTYGFGTGSLSKFFQSSGIQQVTVVQPTDDPASREYAISLNDSNVSELINHLLTISKATWARNEWTGGYGAMQQAFGEDRLLFYNEVVQKFDYFNEEETPNLKLGVLPMPKLNEEQESYYTQGSYQACLACVPKTSPSKKESTYLLDILSWTGQEYVMGYTVELNDDGEEYKKFNGKGYYGYLSERVSDYRDEGDSMDILINDIMDNLIYDVGYMDNWNGLLNSVQNDSYSSGENKFQSAYEAAYDTANQTVAKWNKNWKK